MRKVNFEVQLPVSILREEKYFVAYSPALDLSTSAETFDKVKQRFSEAVQIFLEELQEKGTLDEVLSDLGWVKTAHRWVPPSVVAHESEKVAIPI